MPTNFDLDALRALVVANDLGGYGRAAARLHRTASAISLQMKRLQRDAGAPLFRKDGRAMALTEAGEIVLRYARRMVALNDELHDTLRGAAIAGTIRVGCAQDFAEAVLPHALARFAARYPLVTIELRIEGNSTLADSFARGELDLALLVGHEDAPSAETLGTLPLAWIASPEYLLATDKPVPLLALGPRCPFRRAAIDALESAGRPWRLAAVSAGVAGLWAAATAGLGVTLRTPLGAPSNLVADDALLGLPSLGVVPVTLHRRGDDDGIARLAALLAADVEARLTIPA